LVLAAAVAWVGCSEGTAPEVPGTADINLTPGAATLVAGPTAEIAPTGGRYMVAVVNTSTTPNATASFQLRGSGGTNVVSTSLSPPPMRPAFAAGAPSADVSIPQRRDAHAELLEGDRRLVGRVGMPRSGSAEASLTAGDSGPPLANSVPLQVGASANLRVRSFASCATFTEVAGRVVYVGSRSVIVEASDSPLAGQMDADFQALGEQFDSQMFDILQTNFGNPLAYDARLDNNGRIIMLFTRVVNGMGANIMGFVSSCDFYPPTQHPDVRGSNQAEIFYARVPLNNAINYNSFDTRVGWLRNVRSTIIHEVKHLTSYAERFARATGANPVIEENWLEEGTAQVAVELFARNVYYGPSAAWKANASYEQTIYCDFRPTVQACGGRPFLVADHFLFLNDYMRNIEARSFLSRSSDDQTVYGSAWMFSRWAADQYAATEAGFFRALTTEPTLTGMANVQARTGRNAVELITNFLLSLYADDYPGMPVPGGARYTIPSWNLRDIYAGLARDFPQSFGTFPLNVRQATFGTFQHEVPSLMGASASYFELTGNQTGPQLVELRAAGGGQLPPGSPLRLYVLRVQ
jgi:hypothetical protein